MNKRLVKDGFECYVEIETMGGEDYEYQMLQLNSMSYILPVNLMTVNDRQQLIYSASGYKTLEHCFKKNYISDKQVECIMEAVLNGIDEIKQYLLVPGNLVLMPDCMFADSSFTKVGLVYVPGYNKDIIHQFRNLMEQLIENMNQTDVRSMMLSWRVYVLLKDENMSLAEIRRILYLHKGNEYNDEGLMEYRTERKLREVEEDERHWGSGKKRRGEGHSQQESRKERRGEGYSQQESKKERKIRHSLKRFGKESRGIEHTKRKEQTLLWISVVVSIVFVLSELIILYSIYVGGILPWKSLALIINTVLLVISGVVFLTLLKKENVRRVLKEIREKSQKRI